MFAVSRESGDVFPLLVVYFLSDIISHLYPHRLCQCSSRSVCVFLLATYTDGQPTDNAHWFCKWLEEASTDFRYGKTYLRGLRYAVFGLGHSAYVGHYNTVRTDASFFTFFPPQIR